MLVKNAVAATGGLSNPGKMPGYGYGLPAAAAPWVPEICKANGWPVPPIYGCPIGSVLHAVSMKHKGHTTVCSKCYATRGNYAWTNTRVAQVRRLIAYHRDPSAWTEGMVFLINREKDKGHAHFRWHDSGDLLHLQHLLDIVEVARYTSGVTHWLPTRERGILQQWTARNPVHPANLVIRLSAQLIDGKAPAGWPLTSTVHKDGQPIGHACPARNQGNECRQCRACWDPAVANVSYSSH